jgi:tetratricopeptide (TPR) repeat protein
MTPEEKYELFDRFCSDELSAADKQMLTKLISDDESIAEEFKLYQELNSHLDARFISEKEEEILENNLKVIGDLHFNKKAATKKTKEIRMPVWVYATAASIAVIFGVYFFDQSNPTYHDFANIPELSITERGNAEKNRKNAEHAFNSKNYVKAEKYLLALLSKDENNVVYQFYYGLSLLEQDKYVEATQVLEKLYEGKSAYKYKALWFEALNQLKQKKYDQCTELLKNIPKEAEDYIRAQELLKKI